MNERMLDLAIQAKDWAYADHDGYTAQMLFEQKFAELIVRQCADITDSIGEHGYIASEEMLEQFGVK